LPDDFLPSLGRRFLERQYYPAALRSGHGSTMVAVDTSENVVGFVTVASDSDSFSWDVLRGRTVPFAWYAMLRALRQPLHLLKTAQVFLAAMRKTYPDWPGEIVFIAVDAKHRKKGVGRGLVAAALSYLTQHGVRRCRTKTLAANDTVIRMYQTAGWEIVDRYRLIGREHAVLLSPELDADRDASNIGGRGRALGA
jgi:ribosomal protein S18 acetylase RimI-like enzyme